ncbi:MAG: hypothetical protein BRC30_03810, partial [Nanohaloarchaea archaeon SW_7_46_7]
MLITNNIQWFIGVFRVEECSVLVAEDDDDLRELYEHWFDEMDGFAGEFVENGEKAQSYMEDVDIAILDIDMPKKTGYEVVEDYGKDDTLIMMVTGRAADEKLVDLPVNDYLNKPVNKDDIYDSLEKMTPF